MTYFANGREAFAFGERYCNRCANQNPADGGCAIMDIHFVFNADQRATGQEKLKDALTMLISDDWKCSMFRENNNYSEEELA